ncbi:MAG: efflux RND transporter periplasmic adaptor subunit [Burkholderiales bacterium]|nr:efflux RND transporter periplasmic adaptor subunit [Burkholderiales bacterium]
MNPSWTSVVLAALLTMQGTAWSHGDEDHSPAPVVPAAAPSPASAGPAALAAPRRLADGSLYIPKAAQYQWALRTEPAAPRAWPVTMELNGKVVVDAQAGGRVQSTQPGRIAPPPQGLPTLGQRVRKGQILALVHPSLSNAERGGLQAQLAELDAQRSIAERKADRYAQLEGAVPQAAIDANRLELQALRQRRSALAAGLEQPEPLRAPLSGVISAVQVQAGQVVDARETLFEVVDPDRLAVEALAYDASAAQDVQSASATTPDGDVELRFVGSGRQLREQAWVLLFRAQPGHGTLAVGQPLKVLARTAPSRQGTAIPRAALARASDGTQTVWVHTSAERFERRTVQAAALDAERVVLTSGIAPGERIVTQGAGLLAQVR